MIIDRDLPIRKFIPSIITLVALCFGLSAIRMAIEGKFEMSINFIIIAMILDGLDGRLARMLKATSKFGVEIDSLCDFVNFGVAPSLILYFWRLSTFQMFGWSICLFMSICIAVRLARFNVISEDKSDNILKNDIKKSFFTGLPSPMAGMMFLLPLSIDNEFGFVIQDEFLLAYLALIAFMAISRVPTFSIKGLKISRKNAPIILSVILFIITLAWQEFHKTVILLTIIYFLSVPFAIIDFYKKTKQLNKK